MKAGGDYMYADGGSILRSKPQFGNKYCITNFDSSKVNNPSHYDFSVSGETGLAMPFHRINRSILRHIMLS